MKNQIIMPKATALWLKNNTNLTSNQISEFCGLDLLTLDSLNSDMMHSLSPMQSGQLTKDEIKKGEENPDYKLKNFFEMEKILPPKSQRKYIPLAFRKQKAFIIAWFVQRKASGFFSEKSENKIAKILSTSKNYVKKIIEDIKVNEEIYKNILDPLKIGICTKEDINDILGE